MSLLKRPASDLTMQRQYSGDLAFVYNKKERGVSLPSTALALLCHKPLFWPKSQESGNFFIGDMYVCALTDPLYRTLLSQLQMC